MRPGGSDSDVVAKKPRTSCRLAYSESGNRGHGVLKTKGSFSMSRVRAGSSLLAGSIELSAEVT